MRSDAFSVLIGNHRIRVIYDDPDRVKQLRNRLEAHLTNEAAPLGFAITRPSGRQRLYVLLDRSGFVLGRTRSPEEIEAMMLSHLAAFFPPPSGSVRLKLRGLVTDDSRVVLAGFPLFTQPPAVERQLERASFRLLDRLVVDLSVDLEVRTSLVPPEFANGERLPTGHALAGSSALNVVGTLLPKAGARDPSPAASIALLAGTMSPHRDRGERLDLASAIAARGVYGVDLSSTSARYRALKQAVAR